MPWLQEAPASCKTAQSRTTLSILNAYPSVATLHSLPGIQQPQQTGEMDYPFVTHLWQRGRERAAERESMCESMKGKACARGWRRRWVRQQSREGPRLALYFNPAQPRAWNQGAMATACMREQAQTSCFGSFVSLFAGHLLLVSHCAGTFIVYLHPLSARRGSLLRLPGPLIEPHSSPRSLLAAAASRAFLAATFPACSSIHARTEFISTSRAAMMSGVSAGLENMRSTWWAPCEQGEGREGEREGRGWGEEH